MNRTITTIDRLSIGVAAALLAAAAVAADNPVAPVKVRAVANFDFDKATLDADDEAKILSEVGKMKDVTWQKVTAVGHTDSIGPASYNEKLSQRRAQAVKAYLVGKGLEPAMIDTDAKAAGAPVASNDTSAGRAKNRRTEIEFRACGRLNECLWRQRRREQRRTRPRRRRTEQRHRQRAQHASRQHRPVGALPALAASRRHLPATDVIRVRALPLIASAVQLKEYVMSSTKYAPLAAALSLAIGCASAAAQTAPAAAKATADTAKQSIESWPEQSKKTAQMMIQKYGAPAEATPTRLIWFNNGPWKRTTVINEEIDHQFPMPHKDVMEQVIDYKVPPDKADDLAKYDGSVYVDRTRGEISARCDAEAANLVAINLAHDIVSGKRSVEQAREFYPKAIMAHLQQQSSPYAEKLQFKPMDNSAFADKQTVSEKMAKMAEELKKEMMAR